MKILRFLFVFLFVIPIPQSCDFIDPCTCPEPQFYKLKQVVDHEIYTREYFQINPDLYDPPTREDTIRLTELVIKVEMKGELITHESVNSKAVGWTYSLNACSCPNDDIQDELFVSNFSYGNMISSSTTSGQDISEFITIEMSWSLGDKGVYFLLVDEKVGEIELGDYWLDVEFQTSYGETIESSFFVNNLY